MLFSLDGKAAVITGGTRGLGREIALVLAEMGCDLALNYRSDDESARKTVDDVVTIGRRALAIKANLEDEVETRAMMQQACRELGRLDILIVNAVTSTLKPLLSVKPSSFARTINMNLGHFLVCAQEASQLFTDGGRIIAITGSASTRNAPGSQVLACAKAGMESMVRQLAFELGPRGVTVNAVSLGLADTESSRLLLGDSFERFKSCTDERSALKRLGTGEEVANVVGLICAPAASYMTGEIVTVDGGLGRASPYAP
jgi:NAD(P)-dependent dehydrogenase (short-subunit alcohol dehydrogenase family)